MKLRLKWVATAFSLAIISSAFTGCSSEYDDTFIKEQISELDDRVSSLEDAVTSMNADINVLKVLVEKIENNVSIRSYAPISGGGYRIIFTDGTSIDIMDGQDGADGEDGKDGQDGSDGATPVIGVAKDKDGIYYWTVTVNGKTTYLLDENGKKVPVTGKDGLDGKDGNDGGDGEDGKDGKDGVTPVIRIDKNGYWIVSYDNGVTFDFIRDENGKIVSALGGNGESEGDSSYIVDSYVVDNYVVFVFYDGTEVSLPIYNEFFISLESTEAVFEQNINEITISYTVSGYDNYTFVETIDKGNLKSSVDASSTSGGNITIKKTGDLDEDSKVLVLLCNRTQTIVTVISTTLYEDPRLDDVVPEDIQIELGTHMPIYKGVNPPDVTGVYFIDPMAAVYCEDYYFDPGDLVFSEVIRFYNQDMKRNTLDYSEYSESGNTYLNGEGCFISGSGDYFTVFFNTYGESNGVPIKTAMVISGEKTYSGIKDLYYAFIMVDDGGDPYEELMEEGVFRVFEDADGIAVNTSWDGSYATASTRSGQPEWNMFTKVN